ncbi:MAG: hypothetical protein J2P54_08505 [Bradyrhizobiaceae bacterium]|nr:hypothetical protein [Bradyrhizobiaceae bacterium]
MINVTVISYDLTLQLLIACRPDPTLIKQQAANARLCADTYKIGQTSYAEALLAAARVGGVLNVTTDQINDIVCDGTADSG